MGLLVSVGANARCFVVFRTIHICTVIECAIPSSDGPTTSLILKMPMKTRERSMLLTLVLQE